MAALLRRLCGLCPLSSACRAMYAVVLLVSLSQWCPPSRPCCVVVPWPLPGMRAPRLPLWVPVLGGPCRRGLRPPRRSPSVAFCWALCGPRRLRPGPWLSRPRPPPPSWSRRPCRAVSGDADTTCNVSSGAGRNVVKADLTEYLTDCSADEGQAVRWPRWAERRARCLVTAIGSRAKGDAGILGLGPVGIECATWRGLTPWAT